MDPGPDADLILVWTLVLMQTWSWCGPCSWCRPSPGLDPGPDADSGTGVDSSPGVDLSSGTAGCLLATLLTVLAPPPLSLPRSHVASNSNHGLLTSCLYLQSAGKVLVNYRCHTNTSYLGFFFVESLPNLFPFSSVPPLTRIELIVLILVLSSLEWGHAAALSANLYLFSSILLIFPSSI